MTSLYEIIFGILIEIMQSDPALSYAAELVAICVTLLITYFVIFAPLKFVIEMIFRRGKPL